MTAVAFALGWPVLVAALAPALSGVVRARWLILPAGLIALMIPAPFVARLHIAAFTAGLAALACSVTHATWRNPPPLGRNAVAVALSTWLVVPMFWTAIAPLSPLPAIATAIAGAETWLTTSPWYGLTGLGIDEPLSTPPLPLHVAMVWGVAGLVAVASHGRRLRQRLAA